MVVVGVYYPTLTAGQGQEGYAYGQLIWSICSLITRLLVPPCTSNVAFVYICSVQVAWSRYAQDRVGSIYGMQYWPAAPPPHERRWNFTACVNPDKEAPIYAAPPVEVSLDGGSNFSVEQVGKAACGNA